MRRFLLCMFATPLLADPVVVPSGQSIELIERLVDSDGPKGLTWRYRFLAPQVARDTGTVLAETAFMDMEALCERVVAPEVTASSQPPVQVVVSLMDRIVPFGEMAPDATQFFDAYRIVDKKCLWEGF